MDRISELLDLLKDSREVNRLLRAERDAAIERERILIEEMARIAPPEGK